MGESLIFSDACHLLQGNSIYFFCLIDPPDPSLRGRILYFYRLFSWPVYESLRGNSRHFDWWVNWMKSCQRECEWFISLSLLALSLTFTRFKRLRVEWQSLLWLSLLVDLFYTQGHGEWRRKNSPCHSLRETVMAPTGFRRANGPPLFLALLFLSPVLRPWVSLMCAICNQASFLLIPIICSADDDSQHSSVSKDTLIYTDSMG